jgi:phosphoribosylformimino-5-aminoimidazole carboxamide ribotide isomerase
VRIIPVMDILNGQVIHAVRGKRCEYQPLTSILINSSDPLTVALTFKTLGFKDLYVADLDSIMNNGENLNILKRISSETQLNLLVDQGVEDLEKVERLLEINVSYVIVGTETLSDLAFLDRILEIYGKEKIIVSLDLVNRKVFSKSENLRSKSPVAAASKLEEMGIRKIILLDLARVGSGEGVDVDLLGRMSCSLRSKILVGGGVRDIEDLLVLKNLGVAGALVATALHSGKLTVGEIRKVESENL